jgi:putative membrane protein
LAVPGEAALDKDQAGDGLATRKALSLTVTEPRMTTLFAFLHHLAAFTLVAALAIELMLVHQKLTAANIRRLLVVDAILGASAGVVLIAGLLRVFVFEKGGDYYFSSLAFIIKLGVFLGVAALSLMPTLEFLSWRKALRAGAMPEIAEKRLRMIQGVLHGETMAIVVILLCAAIMAKGGWV